MQQKIMIIDDEIEILRMLERYFTLNGYAVITAEGGQTVLQKMKEQPDIILLDINMPDMDGLSLCKNIRDFVSCPILFLTANIEDSDKIKGFSVGGDDYIVKPFSVEELGARVAAHLRRENRCKVKTQVLFDNFFVINYAQRTVYFKNEEIPLLKKNLTLSRFYHKIRDKSLIKSGFMKLPGDWMDWVIIQLLRSISEKFVRSLPPLVQSSI